MELATAPLRAWQRRDVETRNFDPAPNLVTRAHIDLVSDARNVMIDHGFQPDFSPEIQREVAQLGDEDVARAMRGVPRDLRHLLWSSVDNRESRDLDQVEVAERIGMDRIRVYVGIADVDALVARGSATDDHAAENTTSVYTGVIVFPMLPERLSTDLTSLNEGEDRCAIVVELDLASDGSVVREDAYRAVVRNHAKLAYEPIGRWLAGEAAAPGRIVADPRLAAQLRLQDEAALRLAGYRRMAGALEIETVEARPVAVNGRVIDIAVTPRNRAREMIENFMVAVNGAMARILERRRVSSIRRVVREPRRWERIVSLAADMGEILPDAPDAVALAGFLARRRAADPRSYPDLSLAIVKLLGPGQYELERRFSRRNGDDHFSLAAAEYAHSTAPNRRFPDLVTQRLIKHSDGRGGSPYTDDELATIARRCTDREDAARKVERTMRKRAAAVLMTDRVGDSFPAVVTGASTKGIYVRLIRPAVEGRVIRGGRGLDIGDTIRVTLVGVDAEKGFIDFAHESVDVERKLERTRRKRAAATRLAGRIGERFEAIVTGVTQTGTWVRLVDGSAEGKLVAGSKGVAAGDRIAVRLVSTDAVHGFIDFANAGGTAEDRQEPRRRRKQIQASTLVDRIGDVFDAVVTGVSSRAVWVKVDEPEAEGRLVRGTRGLAAGDRIRVMLLDADPQRGYIDFATPTGA
jgi:exoribonuclease-2